MDLSNITKKSSQQEKNEALIKLAKEHDSVKLIQKMIDMGANINALSDQENNWSGLTPVYKALWAGNFKVLNYLLDSDAKVYIKDKYNDNHLIQYINNHTTLPVLEKIVDVSKKQMKKNIHLGKWINGMGKSPLYCAFHYNSSEEIINYVYNNPDLTDPSMKLAIFRNLGSKKLEDIEYNKLLNIYTLFKEDKEININEEKFKLINKILEAYNSEQIPLIKELFGEDFEQIRKDFFEKEMKNPSAWLGTSVTPEVFNLLVKPEEYTTLINETEFIKKPFYLQVLKYARGDILKTMIKQGLDCNIKYENKTLFSSLLEASVETTFIRKVNHGYAKSFAYFLNNENLHLSNFDISRLRIATFKDAISGDFKDVLQTRLAKEDKKELSSILKDELNIQNKKPRL